MKRKLCIVHANCQGEPLIQRLMTCADFSDTFECRLFTNYIHEPIPSDLLNTCSLFLYQYLSADWGNLASHTLLSHLPDTARSLCIPNMFFTGYWPTWSSRPGFDYRCDYLDAFVDLGLPAEETMILALHSDIAAKHDLPTRLTETFMQERTREQHTPIRYTDIIEKRFREVRLFNTINHPGPLLMNHAAKGVLTELGFTPPPDATLEALGDPFPEFHLPMNPRVAETFGLSFGGPDHMYPVYGQTMNYGHWVAHYISARQANITDFIGFLLALHEA
ncbi:hypothetical protein GO013_13375 [Pseudodesulfovibrio sp. JC047]|uniref:WcbI family polysaccharide biosynthesis putative acetyltransferase n=1 Tax=Pseudodesulfovibrio sp. JC047 TaxID=2683199 RepID=UPI0013D502E8|nr:WcbI family polysaccharide biosynthesis putative acetyltransferase [Pseudodesulfovibrio sp. JC047]NDV20401.1 hypothetical protein [Pseudodesulfovibrio sp. JC047]